MANLAIRCPAPRFDAQTNPRASLSLTMVGRRKEIRDDCLLLGSNQSTPRTLQLLIRAEDRQRTFWRNYGIGAIACLESNNRPTGRPAGRVASLPKQTAPGAGSLGRRGLMLAGSGGEQGRPNNSEFNASILCGPLMGRASAGVDQG